VSVVMFALDNHEINQENPNSGGGKPLVGDQRSEIRGQKRTACHGGAGGEAGRSEVSPPQTWRVKDSASGP